jgi:T5orf172 domain
MREAHDPLRGAPSEVPRDGRDMLYLAEDGSGEFLKIGKCEGRRTSPPERRMGMYAPANPRGITLRAVWIRPSTIREVEQAAKAELRRLSDARGALHRAEWFRCTAEEGVGTLTPLVAARSLLPR